MIPDGKRRETPARTGSYEKMTSETQKITEERERAEKWH